MKFTSEEIEKLLNEHNLFRTLIETMPDHIYIKDTDSRFLYANKTVLKSMKVETIDELKGKTDFDFHEPELANQYYKNEKEVLNGQPIYNKEEPDRNPETNQRIWLSTTKVPFYDNNGNIAGLVGIGRDITDLEERTKRLESLTHKISETQDILTRSNIAADIVHRLNNLAGTIPVWANTIKAKTEQIINEIQDNIIQIRKKSENAANCETNEHTDFISHLPNLIGTIPIHTNRIKSLIDDKTHKIKEDVNNLRSEVERLNKPRKKEKTAIIPILQTIIDQLAIQYDEKIDKGDMKITKEILFDLHKVSAFPVTLPSAISNIISNGAEAVLLKGKGVLTIKAKNYKDEISEWVKIEITDTGIGVPKENTDKLFMPFFSTKGEGRGYGLWRSKNIIENIGGRIYFDSEKDMGTTFTILLLAQED